MNYCAIKKTDIANGPGVRVSLFVSGCRRHCEGCFNPETWDFGHGQKFTHITALTIFAALRPGWIRGLSLLGGEPFEPENEKALCELISFLWQGGLTGKDIWAYTGYRYEELRDRKSKLLMLADVLVDGEFRKDEKVPGLEYRGSANQRIIDLRRTADRGEIVLWRETNE